MEKISWTDRVRNGDVLQRVEEQRSIIPKKESNWELPSKKHVIEKKIEGRIEMTERQKRRCKQLLDDLRETGGYWKLKEE